MLYAERRPRSHRLGVSFTLCSLTTHTVIHLGVDRVSCKYRCLREGIA